MDISTLIYSECQDPNKVSIYNGIKNCYEVKDVPCGKCYHCKITRINEWVTRMVIQSNCSKYVYFGTLTYSSMNATQYTYDCLPIKSNFNKQNRWCDTPMILRKDHVQKFFKRLRKNTGIKLQYAYCGEYGSTYSRPHYHYLIWSNDPIKKSDIYNAWRAPSIKNPNRTNIIGKIDHVDIKNAPRQIAKNGDVTSVYKYVCKYIQKSDFKFNELKNYKQHEKAFHYWFKKQTILCINHDSYIKKYNVKDFYDYQEMARPFFHCSKKPAIGYQYLEKYIGEFQKSNFKLFGLSGKYIFPLYFIRKTKESLCPIKAQSETNDSTTSYSRIPKMATLLENIIYAQQVAEDTDYVIRPFEYHGRMSSLEYSGRIQDLEYRDDEHCRGERRTHYMINRDYLSFVNHATKVKYIFCGDCYEMYSTTTKEQIGVESIENVKQLITYYYEKIKPLLLSLMAQSEISADKKTALINSVGGIDNFNEKKALCLESFNRQIECRQIKYKQTKTLE